MSWLSLPDFRHIIKNTLINSSFWFYCLLKNVYFEEWKSRLKLFQCVRPTFDLSPFIRFFAPFTHVEQNLLSLPKQLWSLWLKIAFVFLSLKMLCFAYCCLSLSRFFVSLWYFVIEFEYYFCIYCFSLYMTYELLLHNGLSK